MRNAPPPRLLASHTTQRPATALKHVPTGRMRDFFSSYLLLLLRLFCCLPDQSVESFAFWLTAAFAGGNICGAQALFLLLSVSF